MAPKTAGVAVTILHIWRRATSANMPELTFNAVVLSRQHNVGVCLDETRLAMRLFCVREYLIFSNQKLSTYDGVASLLHSRS